MTSSQSTPQVSMCSGSSSRHAGSTHPSPPRRKSSSRDTLGAATTVSPSKSRAGEHPRSITGAAGGTIEGEAPSTERLALPVVLEAQGER